MTSGKPSRCVKDQETRNGCTAQGVSFFHFLTGVKFLIRSPVWNLRTGKGWYNKARKSMSFWSVLTMLSLLSHHPKNETLAQFFRAALLSSHFLVAHRMLNNYEF